MNLAKLWKQWRCEHFWRPAISHRLQPNERPQSFALYFKPPIKVCDYCGKEVELTPEEFYAQFGRIPF
jgi:hypothetical protein